MRKLIVIEYDGPDDGSEISVEEHADAWARNVLAPLEDIIILDVYAAEV